MIETISIKAKGQGLWSITDRVATCLQQSDVENGICNLFIRHTSASLLIQENYDRSAQTDLENWLNRLVPENDSLYTHVMEGADDMPAHIKAALTASNLSIPFQQKSLMLGTWQGIYLWEHRHGSQVREIVIHTGL